MRLANRLAPVLLVIAGLMLARAPFMIEAAPVESTMGIIQKIFYYHVPSAIMAFMGAFVCGVASAIYLYGRNRFADHVALSAAELTVVFGLIMLVTGPLWARKAWGAWWVWDVRLTTTLLLWLTFIVYLFARRYGGPGSKRLAAGLALFGAAVVPLDYVSVSIWRTIH